MKKTWKIYSYDKCGTCRKAISFLEEHKIPFEKIAIQETPPNEIELRKMIAFKGGAYRKVFNTSGMDYRALGLSSKLDDMNEMERIKLLCSNGMLVKRPFVLIGSRGLVGFKQAEWDEALEEWKSQVI